MTDPVAQHCDDWQYELDEGPPVGDRRGRDLPDRRRRARPPLATLGPAGRGRRGRLHPERPPRRRAGRPGRAEPLLRRPHAWDTDSIDLALVFASHAATAISNTQLVSGLQTALQSRHLIGVAQGILMAQYDMGLETAFEVLRRYSSHTNVKLRDVAKQVVELRALPDDYSEITTGESVDARLAAPARGRLTGVAVSCGT